MGPGRKPECWFSHDAAHISSNIVVPSEWTTSRNQCALLSIDFDRLMTSEGTETLVLTINSKTEQSVARYVRAEATNLKIRPKRPTY